MINGIIACLMKSNNIPAYLIIVKLYIMYNTKQALRKRLISRYLTYIALSGLSTGQKMEVLQVPG